jgi:hypothetical protein
MVTRQVSTKLQVAAGTEFIVEFEQDMLSSFGRAWRNVTAWLGRKRE